MMYDKSEKEWLLKVIQGLEWLDRGIAYSWWILLGAAFFVTWEVVMRYAFYSPHDWFEEVIVFVCVLGCMLGAGRATKEKRQVSLGLLYARLKGRWLRVADISIGLVLAVASGFMSVCLMKWGMFLARTGVTTGTTLGLPVAAIAYAVLTGMVLNTIYGLEVMLRAFVKMPSEEKVSSRLNGYVQY